MKKLHWKDLKDYRCPVCNRIPTYSDPLMWGPDFEVSCWGDDDKVEHYFEATGKTKHEAVENWIGLWKTIRANTVTKVVEYVR